MPDPTPTLGARVRAHRQALRLTLRETGARAGLSIGFLWGVEHGRQQPGVASLTRIAAALGVPASVLLDGHGPEAALHIRAAKAEGALAFAHQWYAERWERLRRLIREEAPDIEAPACCIMANGTADAMECPSHAQLLNAAQYRAAAAEAELARLRDALAALTRTDGLCNQCGLGEADGHHPGCRVAAALYRTHGGVS